VYTAPSWATGAPKAPSGTGSVQRASHSPFVRVHVTGKAVSDVPVATYTVSPDAVGNAGPGPTAAVHWSLSPLTVCGSIATGAGSAVRWARTAVPAAAKATRMDTPTTAPSSWRPRRLRGGGGGLETGRAVCIPDIVADGGVLRPVSVLQARVG